MPRIALLCLLVVGACSFDADYTGGTYRCGDGKCPSGLTCIGGQCALPGKDAAVDTVPEDAMIDAREAALLCLDPGILPAGGGTVMGTTVGRDSTVSASCNAGVMNSADAVYRVDANVNQSIMVSITGTLNAYVIAPCSATPATPMCIGSTAASMNSPISVTAAFTGQYFIVVDQINPATTGPYTLTVAVN